MEQNDKEVIDQVERIRKKFKTEFEEEENSTDMSFIEEVNDLIRSIFKDEKTDVYTILTPEKLEEWKKRRRWTRRFKEISLRDIFSFILLITITGFLVSEAVSFYAESEIVTAKTWMQAILTEICFIFVSAYRPVGQIQTVMVNFARVGIFALMLFVISSKVVSHGLNTVGEIDVIQQKIELLEDQIKQKDDLIEYYKKKDWGNNVKQQSAEKAKLVEELMKLKSEQAGGKTENASDLVVYNTWAKAFFRIVLIFVSVLISRKIFKF